MAKKPVDCVNTPKETVSDFQVEGIATRAALDNFQNSITIKMGGMLLAMVILVMLIEVLW